MTTKDMLLDIYRAMRGSNGDPGLIADVRMLTRLFNEHVAQDCKRDDRMEKLENEIDSFRAHIVESEGEKMLVVEKDRGRVTWAWIRDKLTTPIFLAIIMIVIEVLKP